MYSLRTKQENFPRRPKFGFRPPLFRNERNTDYEARFSDREYDPCSCVFAMCLRRRHGGGHPQQGDEAIDRHLQLAGRSLTSCLIRTTRLKYTSPPEAKSIALLPAEAIRYLRKLSVCNLTGIRGCPAQRRNIPIHWRMASCCSRRWGKARSMFLKRYPRSAFRPRSPAVMRTQRSYLRCAITSWCRPARASRSMAAI